MRENQSPELSIVLLNYNRIELTKKAVRNLLQDGGSVDFELIVVDNASTDGTREYLRTLQDPRVRRVLNEKNLFFGGGNNTGIEQCGGEYVLFTQNDMTFQPQSMRNLIELYRLLPNAGCAGIGGGFINRLGVITEISDWWQNPLRRFDYVPVDFISGCCMFFHRDVLMHHGIRFDQQYRLYWEDVDICHQVRELGYGIYMLHNGLIGTRHLRSGTITPLLGVEEREKIRSESEAVYRKKWCSLYADPNRMSREIHYGTFFSHLQISTEQSHPVPEEIQEHRDDAKEIAPLEFLEFLGEFEEAVSGYRQVIRQNPDNFLAYRNLCRIVTRNGNHRECRHVLSEFRDCLERRPPVVLRQQLYAYIQSALLRIARDHVSSGDYQAAFSHFNELQEIAQTAPTIALCEIEKAKMKYLMGAYQEAEPEMKAWLEKNEFLDLEPMMFAAAHFYLGEMARLRNDIKVATDRYAMTLTIEPDHQRARARLAELQNTGA